MQFNSGAASKERYLVDTDFDTKDTVQSEPRDIQLEAGRPPTPKPATTTPSADQNGELMQEIQKALEERAAKVEAAEEEANTTNDENNNDDKVENKDDSKDDEAKSSSGR